MIAADTNDSYFERLFTVSGRTLVIALAIPVVVLAAINLLHGGLLFLGINRESAIVSFLLFFDHNGEFNFPAFYNSLLLVGASFVNFHAWRFSVRKQRPFQRAWLALTVIFLYMAMDEILAIHERSTEPLREAFDAGGLLYWTWVIPGIAIVLVLGLAFTPFLRRLPQRTFRLVMIAACTYILGAIVIEMFGGYFYDSYGGGVLTDVSIILEETAEMTGVIVYIYAICAYLDFAQNES